MTGFKEYFLEYRKGDNAKLLNPNPRNGKNAHIPTDARKNPNVIVKTYKHKDSLVDRITAGQANNVQLKGQPVSNLLKKYDTHFEPGIKSLGNSGVEAVLSVDSGGIPRAILRRKKKNVL